MTTYFLRLQHRQDLVVDGGQRFGHDLAPLVAFDEATVERACRLREHRAAASAVRRPAARSVARAPAPAAAAKKPLREKFMWHCKRLPV